MDERKRYTIVLADGTLFVAEDDMAGNFIADTVIEKDAFSPDNISEVTIMDGENVVDVRINQVLRTYYITEDNETFIRLDDMNDLEKIEADYNSKLDYITCMTGVDLDE